MNWFLDKASKGIGKLSKIMCDEDEPLHNTIGKPLASLGNYLAKEEEEKDQKLKEKIQLYGLERKY